MPFTPGQLQKLCESLRQADPDIVDIIQFGSSVYAPDLARDIDILVTTRAKKDDAYWDAIADDAFDDVDLMVKEHGEPLGRDIALSVVATGQVLYGDGEVANEAKSFIHPAAYDHAKMHLEIACEDFSLAYQRKEGIIHEERCRLAYENLFRAARYAAMTYVAFGRAGEEQSRLMLPPELDEQFHRIIKALHVEFQTEGTSMQNRPDAAFDRWRQVVSEFIEDLEQRTPKSS